MALPKTFLIIDALEFKQVNALRKYLLSRMGEQSDLFTAFEMIVATKANRSLCDSVEILRRDYFPESSVKTVSNNCSTLFLLTEDWIAIEQLNKEMYSKDLLLQRWYNDNGIYHIADQVHRKVLKSTETEVQLDMMLPKAKAETLYEHLFSSNPAKYDVKSGEYDTMIDAFLEFTFLQNFLFLIELVNRAEVANLEVKKRKVFLEKMLKLMPKTELTSILQLVYDMIAFDDVEAFQALRKILQKDRLLEGSKLHFYVTTYVVKRSMKFWSMGKLSDSKIIFQLASYGLNHGIYFTNGKLPTATFHNLVAQLCQAASYNQMITFVNKWIDMVHTENLDATRGLSIAQVAFYNNRFNDIYLHTWRRDFEEFNQRNLAQSLHLIATFMNRKSDHDTYRHTLLLSQYFIKRNRSKMSAHLYTSYTNLYKFMKAYEAKRYSAIDLDKLSPLLYRSWCERMMKKIK